MLISDFFFFFLIKFHFHLDILFHFLYFLLFTFSPLLRISHAFSKYFYIGFANTLIFYIMDNKALTIILKITL